MRSARVGTSPSQARKLGRLRATVPEDLIREAVAEHIITPKEADLMHDAERLRDLVIQVDAFAYYGRKNLRSSPLRSAKEDAA